MLAHASMEGLMSNRLLLVDDDQEVLSINKKFFEQYGYDVVTATDSVMAIGELSDNSAFDCIVLDIMMPGVNGFELCKWVKDRYNTPVIFLTGKDSEDDKVNGLLLGADDYMVKPYSLRELEVRIQVLIRRYKNTASPRTEIIDFAPLHIDLSKHAAYFNDEKIQLSNKELDFLILLAKSPTKTFTFEELGNSIWGGYIDSDRKTIMVTASRLRKKLDLYPGLENSIETIWSKGYKFAMNKKA